MIAALEQEAQDWAARRSRWREGRANPILRRPGNSTNFGGAPGPITGDLKPPERRIDYEGQTDAGFYAFKLRWEGKALRIFPGSVYAWQATNGLYRRVAVEVGGQALEDPANRPEIIFDGNETYVFLEVIRSLEDLVQSARVVALSTTESQTWDTLAIHRILLGYANRTEKTALNYLHSDFYFNPYFNRWRLQCYRNALIQQNLVYMWPGTAFVFAFPSDPRQPHNLGGQVFPLARKTGTHEFYLQCGLVFDGRYWLHGTPSIFYRDPDEPAPMSSIPDVPDDFDSSSNLSGVTYLRIGKVEVTGSTTFPTDGEGVSGTQDLNSDVVLEIPSPWNAPTPVVPPPPYYDTTLPTWYQYCKNHYYDTAAYTPANLGWPGKLEVATP